ncbi:unnamed protein product [Larinioides sclopetarius]|uniref:Alpha-carbonic anhydrase domain-containing protein n=1 Tax=Larinioides sclopetarius TaxID=280406 RepID=A0AAV2AMN3_9ARAC
MKPKIGFLSLMCHVLYFQGHSCTWKCPNRSPQCMGENEMMQDGVGSTAYVYSGGSTSWEDWWTYDGISGPDFWGLLNLEWSLCSKGRRQSPVNIDPSGLLYDPSLRSLHVDKIRVNGLITNTGHGVIFRTTPASHNEILNITGGPLSYKYRFSEIHIHFARSDEKGSEHLIAGYQFPAELQIYGYNSDLYQNISEAIALQKNQGLVGISILLQTGDLSNSELRIITSQLHKIVHRGQEAQLKYLSLRDLMPDTSYYMTYEGSTTMPGCYETVTWIIMNKPIYITKQQLFALRRLMQGDERNPKAPLADNFRPTLDLNQRSIRTNIDFRRKPGSECPTMNRRVHYQANVRDRQKGP